MSIFGLTTTGFNVKRLADIRAEMRADFEAVFGAKTNTSSDAVISQIIDVFSGQLSLTWEALEQTYHAFDPASAEGVPLENLAAMFLLFRADAKPSTGVVRITGTAGTVVPEGYETRSTSTDTNVVTTDAAMIGVAGFVDVAARSVDVGPVVIGAGDVDTSVDFVAGVTDVTNSADFVLGEVEESDDALAVRRADSLQAGGSAVDRAIRAKLLALTFVDQALVISNRSNAVDANGFPPNSTSSVLWPPTADLDERQEVVDLLVRNAPGGIEMNGDINYFVTDEYGYTDPLPYGFSFASEQGVHLNIAVTKSSLYPADGDTQVQDAAVNAGNDLSVGADVVLLRLLCEVAKVSGVLTIEVTAKVGSAPGPADTSDIAILLTQIARFSTANTTVVS